MEKLKTLFLQHRLFIETILILTLILYILYSHFELGKVKAEVKKQTLVIESYKAKTQVFNSYTDDLGRQVTTQKQAVVDLTKENKKLLKQNSNLKAVSSQIKIVTKLKLDSISIKYLNNKKDTTFVYSDSTCVPIGTKFTKEDEWYIVSGEVGLNTITIDSLITKESLVVNTGSARPKGFLGFLESNIPTVEIISLNPHTKITNLNNLTLQPVTKWYQKTSTKLIAGFVSGLVISYQIFK